MTSHNDTRERTLSDIGRTLRDTATARRRRWEEEGKTPTKDEIIEATVTETAAAFRATYDRGYEQAIIDRAATLTA